MCSSVWAQSPAEREQQRQAQQVRERHPGSSPAPKSAPAAVKTPDRKAQAPRPKQGEAAVSTDGSLER
jgi:hypothetical protein